MKCSFPFLSFLFGIFHLLILKMQNGFSTVSTRSCWRAHGGYVCRSNQYLLMGGRALAAALMNKLHAVRKSAAGDHRSLFRKIRGPEHDGKEKTALNFPFLQEGTQFYSHLFSSAINQKPSTICKTNLRTFQLLCAVCCKLTCQK
jgi:hypothetical protein